MANIFALAYLCKKFSFYGAQLNYYELPCFMTLMRCLTFDSVNVTIEIRGILLSDTNFISLGLQKKRKQSNEQGQKLSIRM